jgi:heme-degrading monooxygenase HmoA
MTDEFQAFFLDEALPLVRSQEGLQRATVVLPLDGNPNKFLMISEWDSLESLKKFAGEEWDETVIDPREAHLCRPEQHTRKVMSCGF